MKTGIPYSFLCNNWYLKNEIPTIQGVLAGAPWVTSAGNGKVGWAPQQDYVEAAATVLSANGHENSIYELSGKLLTQEELAAAVGKVVGKEVHVRQVDDATYAEKIRYPAKGEQHVAYEVETMFAGNGIPFSVETERGLGAWIVLRLLYP